MSTPVKIGLGVLGCSTIVIPGVWMTVTGEPNSTTLADNDVKDYTGKFGEDFKHHLVDAKAGKNQSWWDWSFKYRWQKDNEKGSDFTGVTDGSSLRTKCEGIYKKENKSEEKSEEKSAWRYCSLEGQKPVTVKEENGEAEGAEGTQETIKKKHKDDLISTTDPRNSKFWEIQQKAFFKAIDGLGSKATEKSSFKTLYENKSSTLSNKCQENYLKKETEATQDKKDVLVFCSLNPRKST